MSRIHDQRHRMRESHATGRRDEDLLRRNFQVMSEVRQQMFEGALQSRKDIDAVLTPEQRLQLSQTAGPRGKR